MNFGRNTLILTISKIASLIMSIAITVILSRYRTLGEYGTYAQLILIVNLSVSILSFGISNSINYFLGKYDCKEERDNFVIGYFILNTLFGIITGILLGLYSEKLGVYFNNTNIPSYRLVLLILPWSILTNSSMSFFLIFSNRSKFVLIIETTYNFVIFITALISSLLGIDFKSYLYFFTIVNATQSIFVYIIVHRIYKLKNKFVNFRIIKEILIFSIPLGLSTLIGTLNLQVDQIMVSSLYKLDEYAVYANAARELPIAVLSSSIVLVVFPTISKLLNKKRIKEAMDVWRYSIDLSSIIMFFLISVLIVFASEIITILYSEKFLMGVSVFRIYSLVLVFRITYFGMVLNSLNKTKYILMTSIFALISNVILNFIFHKMFGFIGPAVATLCVTSFVALLQLKSTARMIDFKFIQIFPWVSLLKIGILNLLLSIVFYYIKVFFMEIFPNLTLFTSVIIGLAWFIVYFLIVCKNARKKWDVLNSSTHYDII
ncbi:MAG TPA: hypothetical protein DIC19_05780 [Erysipelotrichaceae bacterium]|nr:hypothetical protein [Erysipelotrichaceae bacterium]